MKHHIERLMQQALKQLQEVDELPAIPAFIEIEKTKNKQHGDLTSNIAMILAKVGQKTAKEMAEQIVSLMPASPIIEKVIAVNGYINFFISLTALKEVVPTILNQKDAYGRCKIGRGKRILIEFLSANPTGPLHVGHGRHIAFGIAMANLLDAVGFKSYREYYINDSGRQMDILAISIWLRYLQLCDKKIAFPSYAYQGDYLVNIATIIFEQHQHVFCPTSDCLSGILAIDNDEEHALDQLILQMKHCLNDQYLVFFNIGLEHILADIRDDLNGFGVQFDNWFSERQFAALGMVNSTIELLKERGHVYLSEGALWLRSTAFGDEKDRVLIRSNGQPTYCAHDIAYHLNKFDRGFDIVVDVLGSDHHGYIPRIRAALEASGVDPERLIHLLVQFVTLHRGSQPLPMSMRKGHFVSLRDLRSEVGNDATRFFYLMRRNEQHMDFDLALAASQSQENPLYYVQYAFVRICSVFKQLEKQNLIYDEPMGLASLDLLTSKKEHQLLNTLSLYPDMIMTAALRYQPHFVTLYLRDLAADFHAYYNSQHFIVEDAGLRNARLALISAVKQTLLNGFNLLSIHLSESM